MGIWSYMSRCHQANYVCVFICVLSRLTSFFLGDAIFCASHRLCCIDLIKNEMWGKWIVDDDEVRGGL